MSTRQAGMRAESSGAAIPQCSISALLLVVVLSMAACGAPGEPAPPTPVVPVAATDLSARQLGDGALLTFTLPAKSITGDRLAESPAIEVLRGTLRPDGAPDANSFQVVETIPGELVVHRLKEDHVEISDPIAPEEIRGHPGAAVAYAVRTRASKKRASANSNTVVIRLYPIPERIASVKSNVTEKTVELTWSAPTKTSAGDPLSNSISYRVYRGEVEPDSVEEAAKDSAAAKFRVRLALLGSAEAPEYLDSSFEFGRSYVYVVRSITSVAGEQIESGDSVAAVVKPVDVFPPASPQGVVAAVLRGANEATWQVELSWSINSETDLAGYRVYRSEQEGTKGVSITSDLLLTPAVRDTSVLPGHRYWYTITAVDRAGNESAPSQPVSVDVTQP